MSEYIERKEVLELIDFYRDKFSKNKDFFVVSNLNTLYDIISDNDCFPTIINLTDNQRDRMVYVCSSNSLSTEENIENTRQYCKFVIEQNRVPLAPYLMFSQLISSNNPTEQGVGTKILSDIMDCCAEFWILGSFSSTMKNEIEMAISKKKKIKYYYKEWNGQLERRPFKECYESLRKYL